MWVGFGREQTVQVRANHSLLARVDTRVECRSCQAKLSYLLVCMSQGWEQTEPTCWPACELDGEKPGWADCTYWCKHKPEWVCMSWVLLQYHLADVGTGG